MDDYQVILYIIFGIIYFIFNILKNKAKPPATLEDETPEEVDAAPPPVRRRRETVSNPFDETVGRPQHRPSSFEELLQEFQDASGEASRRAEEKVKKVKEVEEDFESTYQTPASYSEQEVEKRMRETEMRKTLQEKASAAERAEATSNEVSRKLEEAGPEMEGPEQQLSAKRGRKENMRRKQILAMLQNPESLRNTVVAAEILKPKHF